MTKKNVKCDIGIAQYDNGTIKSEKKKVRKPPNVRKKLSLVMLKLHNVRMKLSNAKKVREPSNVTIPI